MLLNFSQVFRGSMSRRVRLTGWRPRLARASRKYWQEGTLSEKKIVVVPIEGIITGQIMEQGGYSMVTIIKETLKRREKIAK